MVGAERLEMVGGADAGCCACPSVPVLREPCLTSSAASDQRRPKALEIVCVDVLPSVSQALALSDTHFDGFFG